MAGRERKEKVRARETKVKSRVVYVRVWCKLVVDLVQRSALMTAEHEWVEGIGIGGGEL